ncbi:Uncharacterised protein [Fusobacterium necrogenes]|uniref:TPM domain-containing protein n=1 Tax=Fusobacterium necrogenes TaxID=858 RepID=A0A377GYM7_9FUSO|nr:hypothetical protein [Fusobacterium necrogenes]STO32107.1 Uncharacterised protein [Fusobacterium necrogenes]
MRKKIFIVGIFLINLLLFGRVNDNLNLFDEVQKVELEKKIEDIGKKRDINIYVNSFSGEEGFVVEQAERVLILNLIKSSEEKFKVELKVTKDMELDDIQGSIDEVLNINERYLAERKIVDYTMGVLDGLDGIIDKIKIEDPIVIEEEITEEKKNKFLIGMGALFFLIFILIIRILMVKYKKSFKEEIEIVSKKK